MAEDARRRNLSFSSEYPYKRWFGIEILDHKPSSVRMDFMKSGRAPLLMDHNQSRVIGIIESARIDSKDKAGRAGVRFGRGAEASEKLADVDDGILVNVSTGYRVHELVLEKSTEHEDTYRVTDWEPLEASLVGIPADPTVGINRSQTEHEEAPQARTSSDVSTPAQPAIIEVRKVDVNQSAAAGASADIDTSTVASPVEYEKKRKEAIRKLCIANKLDERYEQSWVQSGADLNKVADDLISIINERAKTNPDAVTHLDLSKSDTRKYSLMRALRAAANKDWKDAGLELECNKEISKRLDRLPRAATGFFVPLDVMMRNLPHTGTAQRDMTAAGVSGSNYLISTDNQPSSFIDLLRNTSVALRMGVTRLSGLKGNVTIPKMTSGNTAYWLSDETTQITESQPTIGQLSLSPKNVAALTELSHQLLSQSTPDAETLVMNSIARDLGLAVDVGILRGTGSSGQPTGIATTGSIGGFTGTSLASTGILDAQADVAGANALFPGCGYVTTPAVAALLMNRPELVTTGTSRLWKGNMLEGSLFDLPAMTSAQMSSATMLFGWWPSVILAEWGVLELMINPFSDFTRGLSAVRGWYTCDVGVRYPGAWSYASSIT